MFLNKQGTRCMEPVDGFPGQCHVVGWVSDGVTGCVAVGFRLCAQGVVGRPVAPVICSQMVKRTVIS
ncbi:hypothetical protein ACFRQM_51185, partial [Streptomyces sp. NPDC056831]|uniref:hypothetical protein n=1 Tax=Streptomyces sp. NPDC056831 TaxID=3345954 RepID=UPI00368274B7